MQAVSIVIPNWNGQDLLHRYLPSVLKAVQQYPGPAEVIVVDDASSDGSLDMLHREFAAVKVIAHRQNRGFGRACGSGAAAAAHGVLIFLNSDVSVQPDFIAPLVDGFQEPSVFSVCPLVFDEAGSPSDVSCSIPYLKRGKIRYRPFPADCLPAERNAAVESLYTFFPLGGAFAVDRSRFLQLQGFDDLFYPFYYEDTDLGFRAWRRGWKCVVAPGSRVTHFHRGTIARSFQQMRVRAIRKRNRLLLHWKNLTSPALLRRHLAWHLLRVCYRPFCLDGMIVVATAMALKSMGRALQRRRREQKAVVRREEEIFEMIAAAAEKACRAAAATAGSCSGAPVDRRGGH